jgi:hypothetical protein
VRCSVPFAHGYECLSDYTQRPLSNSDQRSMDNASGQGERNRPGDQAGIIVFGGGGGSGCAGRRCLFCIVVSVVLSVTLTISADLVLLLFSGWGSGIGL